MKKYVAGFLFSEDLQHVLLVKKTHPDWQAGKLNAIGGKVEGEETHADAMRREFKEETGLDIQFWDVFCTQTDGINPTWKVQYYVGTAPYDLMYNIKSPTEEKVYCVDIGNINLYGPLVESVSWLLPMAKECSNQEYKYLVIEKPLQ